MTHDADLHLADQRLRYSTAGSPTAPAVMLVHGFLSHRRVWRHLWPQLAERFYCVALDLLGFGESTKPATADYSSLAQARRVLAVADAVGLDRFAVVGHSMGGQIALLLAIEAAPARIPRLVSVAGVVTGQFTPIVDTVTYPQLLAGVWAPWLYAGWRQLARQPHCGQAMFGSWFYQPQLLPFAAWAMDREMALQPGIHWPAYQAGRALRGHSIAARLERITAPTLLVAGRQDGIVPVTDSKLAARLLPGARLLLLERCGHFPMLEQPHLLLEAIRDFLDS